MKARIVIVTLLVSSAHAADFDSRVDAAATLARSRIGGPYMALLFPTYMHAMEVCEPSGHATDGESKFFTFVADVAPDGSVLSTEVLPRSKYALCFADHVRMQKVPPPPKVNLDRYPISIGIGVKP